VGVEEMTEKLDAPHGDYSFGDVDAGVDGGELGFEACTSSRERRLACRTRFWGPLIARQLKVSGSRMRAWPMSGRSTGGTVAQKVAATGRPPSGRAK
jgi:hypothetical protein